ncbi:NAD(P)-dependent dehydrogenase (short-subunit alcohol dehydrogenase family) [Actinopolymorpha pittospori]|uniref:NAD(P)-dependent dehydrogenase (Short-subunit alcohol dehydrogenase family) n=2 Tax=Actinomycetes TaxID=1760 RepID=A0A927MPE2_9ACTN|nr:NAD(P)-dependent dehydrogenase (short-subunit alcohol dehydrogenase family) [Actinopolymorpha pittospori]
MGKLDGKVAVITGGTTGMALAGAKLFVDEGAHVFITGRRQDALDEAVKQIGRNVTGVQGDAANLDDLDRLYDTVKREKGSLDVLWASAGGGEPAPLGEITEAHFDTWFGLNARGTLFTVQKALPLFNDGGSILMTGSNASLGAFPGWSVYAGSKAVQQAWARIWLNELKDRRIRVNVLTPWAGRHRQAGRTLRRGHQAAVRVAHPSRPDGPPRRDCCRRPLPRLRRLQLRQRHGTRRRRRHYRHLNRTTHNQGRTAHEQHQHHRHRQHGPHHRRAGGSGRQHRRGHGPGSVQGR